MRYTIKTAMIIIIKQRYKKTNISGIDHRRGRGANDLKIFSITQFFIHVEFLLLLRCLRIRDFESVSKCSLILVVKWHVVSPM